jgi:hypothetical protein
MELAAWEGRERVFREIDGEDFAEGGDAGRLDPEEEGVWFRPQIEFLSQKRVRPTRVWTDALYGDHDRAFVVAGVTDTAMLEEFQAAIIEGAKTYDYKAFAAEFDRLVEKYGWSYNGGREWRIRTIFETNIRTSHMAGRLRQMRDPGVVKLLPYWEYVHAETRVPLSPREAHLSWNGLILDWDDPWWDTHFPPNDWACSCGVRTRSRRDLERLGKPGPDKAPPLNRKPYTHRASGQTVMLPEGIGYGWDYMPGDQWSRGLVPSRLLDDPEAEPVDDPRGRSIVSIDEAEPVQDLVAAARPFTATVMETGLAEDAYLRAFLSPFGAESGEDVLWEDVSGTRILISGDIFRAPDGTWKGDKRGHATHAALLAEAIRDPDEIWLGVREVPVPGFPGVVEPVLTRRYVRVDPGSALQAVFEIGRRVWGAVTGFASLNRSKPDYRYLDRSRVGKLLWKRR